MFLSSMSQNPETLNEVCIALGCNVGDKVKSLHQAFKQLQALGKVKKTSFLYRSKPMYHLEQPAFLNCACLLTTSLTPEALLVKLKEIEKSIGRQTTFRNGPRQIDLDIILYNDQIIDTENLVIPHPRMCERGFVLQPLLDLLPDYKHPIHHKTIRELCSQLDSAELADLQQVIPCRNRKSERTRYLRLNSGLPLLMGILNVTPDSDGGTFGQSVDKAISHAIQMIHDGAQIIDIGGESTRPFAETVPIEEEISRIVPVIQGIRKQYEDIIISIDTRKAAVAKAAIEAGADIINDVSGGSYDENMIELVEQNFVPYIAMHSRGNPSNMIEKPYSHYQNVVEEVTKELQQVCGRLDQVIPRWLQIIDPGIGFAKSGVSNLELLKPENLALLKQHIESRPLLIGLSRKRFLSASHEENIRKRENLILNDDLTTKATVDNNNREPSLSLLDRDLLTSGACSVALLGKADIIRVHNVQYARMICDSFTSLL